MVLPQTLFLNNFASKINNNSKYYEKVFIGNCSFDDCVFG